MVYCILKIINIFFCSIFFGILCITPNIWENQSWYVTSTFMKTSTIYYTMFNVHCQLSLVPCSLSNVLFPYSIFNSPLSTIHCTLYNVLRLTEWYTISRCAWCSSPCLSVHQSGSSSPSPWTSGHPPLGIIVFKNFHWSTYLNWLLNYPTNTPHLK